MSKEIYRAFVDRSKSPPTAGYSSRSIGIISVAVKMFTAVEIVSVRPQ